MKNMIKALLCLVFNPKLFIDVIEKIKDEKKALYTILFLFFIAGILIAPIQIKVQNITGVKDSVELFAGGYIGSSIFFTFVAFLGIHFFYFYYLFFMNIITGNKKQINSLVFKSICFIYFIDLIQIMFVIIKSYTIDLSSLITYAEFKEVTKIKIYLNDYLSDIPSFLAGFFDYFSFFHLWQGFLITYLLVKIYKVSWIKGFIPVFTWWLVLYLISTFYSLMV